MWCRHYSARSLCCPPPWSCHACRPQARQPFWPHLHRTPTSHTLPPSPTHHSPTPTSALPLPYIHAFRIQPTLLHSTPLQSLLLCFLWLSPITSPQPHCPVEPSSSPSAALALFKLTSLLTYHLPHVHHRPVDVRSLPIFIGIRDPNYRSQPCPLLRSSHHYLLIHWSTAAHPS